MNNFFKSISLIFAAGCFGGLFKGICACLFGSSGISATLGSQYAPQLTPPWIYQQMVWGGIWAFLFLLPIRKLSYYNRGVWYSLPQTLVALFVMFPQMNRGMLGLKLGYSTPLLILFFGVVWGITTALWLKLARGHG